MQAGATLCCCPLEGPLVRCRQTPPQAARPPALPPYPSCRRTPGSQRLYLAAKNISALHMLWHCHAWPLSTTPPSMAGLPLLLPPPATACIAPRPPPPVTINQPLPHSAPPRITSSHSSSCLCRSQRRNPAATWPQMVGGDHARPAAPTTPRPQCPSPCACAQLQQPFYPATPPVQAASRWAG